MPGLAARQVGNWPFLCGYTHTHTQSERKSNNKKNGKRIFYFFDLLERSSGGEMRNQNVITCSQIDISLSV